MILIQDAESTGLNAMLGTRLGLALLDAGWMLG